MTITAYTECHACHTRIVWAVTSDGKRLPPVGGPDSEP